MERSRPLNSKLYFLSLVLLVACGLALALKPYPVGFVIWLAPFALLPQMIIAWGAWRLRGRKAVKLLVASSLLHACWFAWLYGEIHYWSAEIYSADYLLAMVLPVLLVLFLFWVPAYLIHRRVGKTRASLGLAA